MTTAIHHGPRDHAISAAPRPADTPQPIERVLLTPVEAARALGVGRSKIYELILSRALASVKIGGSRRIPTYALEEFVARLRADQP